MTSTNTNCGQRFHAVPASRRPFFSATLAATMSPSERNLEGQVIAWRSELKYGIRLDIRDRSALEANFRQSFQALNRFAPH